MRRLLVCSFVLLGWTSTRFLASLEPMNFQLIALDDSQDYFVYRYTAANPATSTQGVAVIRLDVSASSGPSVTSLPATGRFLDGSAVESSLPVAPHAQVGPISPAEWQAVLDRSTPFLYWLGVNGRMFDYDSIAPGDSLPDLGIRSTFFPAVREVGAVPTWQSCCQEPWGTDEENPDRMHREPEYFMVPSYALAPGYRAEELTIGLLQDQLDTICTDPLWLNNSTLCSEFSDLLSDAQFSLILGDAYGAAAKLAELRDRVDAEQGQMEPEAYWLLYYNVRQTYWNVAPPLKLECTPSTVERALSVSCTPTPPPGVPFEITDWAFVGGPNSQFQVTPGPEPPATWDGPMVVGGTVSVYANVDSMADTASTVVEVTPRTWPTIAMADPVPEQDQFVLGDMPTVPESQDDLAHYHSVYWTGLTPADSAGRFVTVASGPNATLTYFSDPLIQEYRPFTEINRDALTNDQNPWYQNHPVRGRNTDSEGNLICLQRELSTDVLDFFVDRMAAEVTEVQTYWPQSTLQAVIESTVAVSDSAQGAALSAAVDAETAQVASVRQQLGPAVPPCTLLY